MSDLMRAIFLTGYPYQFDIRQVPKPVPGIGEVLLKIMAWGFCGSEVEGMKPALDERGQPVPDDTKGRTGRRQLEVIPFHEASARIAAVGPDVPAKWSKGQRVVPDSTQFCLECPACKAGAPNLCTNKRVYSVNCGDWRLDGFGQEFVAVPHHLLYEIPDSVSYEAAACAEPLGVAQNAVDVASGAVLGSRVLKFDAIGEGMHIAVLGTGQIGLLEIAILASLNPSSLIAVDLKDENLELAKAMGATHTLNPSSCDVANEVHQITEHGAHVTFEVVGSERTVPLAFEMTRPGGVVQATGNASATVEVAWQQMVVNQRSVVPSCAIQDQFPTALRALADGSVNLSRYVSLTCGMEGTGLNFTRLGNAEPGLIKVIGKPHGDDDSV